MKTILEIDYNCYVLPASANINVLVKALSGAKRVDRRHKSDGDVYYDHGEARVRIEIVKDNQVKPKSAAEEHLPKSGG